MKKKSFALLLLFISVAPFAKSLQFHSLEAPVHAGYRQQTVSDTAEIPDEHIREPMARDKFR